MTGNTLTAAAKFVDTCTSFNGIIESGCKILFIVVVLLALALSAYNIATLIKKVIKDNEEWVAYKKLYPKNTKSDWDGTPKHTIVDIVMGILKGNRCSSGCNSGILWCSRSVMVAW